MHAAYFHHIGDIASHVSNFRGITALAKDDRERFAVEVSFVLDQLRGSSSVRWRFMRCAAHNKHRRSTVVVWLSFWYLNKLVAYTTSVVLQVFLSSMRSSFARLRSPRLMSVRSK